MRQTDLGRIQYPLGVLGVLWSGRKPVVAVMNTGGGYVHWCITLWCILGLLLAASTNLTPTSMARGRNGQIIDWWNRSVNISSPALNIIDVGDQQHWLEPKQKFDLEATDCIIFPGACLCTHSRSWITQIDILYFGLYIFLFSSITLIHQISQHSRLWTLRTRSTSSSNQDLLWHLVAGAHSAGYGTHVLLTIGMSISLEWTQTILTLNQVVGPWGGCYYFSQACSTSANHTKFANAIATTMNTYSTTLMVSSS